MAFVQHMLFHPSISINQRQQALDRAHSDPGIPDPYRTTSPFWLEHPHPRLAKIQSALLATKADVVIVGSGITAASIAKRLLESYQSGYRTSRHLRVVVVEARDICSGATGRNGGHILETAEEFQELFDTVGLEAAKKITSMRTSHLNELIGVAKEYSLTDEAQARQVQFLSVHFDKNRWHEAAASVELFKASMPTESKEWKVMHASEIPKDLCLPHAVGIIAGPAGALWPYKFVTGIFDRLLEQFPGQIRIETNTAVNSIQKCYDDGTNQEYNIVVTPRGEITCKHVIHCTNAHAAHLVPGLRGRIYPVRGQMSAQAPGHNFKSQAKSHSWLFNYENGFDYLTQLPSGPHSSDEMMLGGGFAQGELGGLADLGIGTDDILSLCTDIHLSGTLSVVFGRKNWGDVSGPAVKSMWSGNMGFSADGFPWVGQLPESLTHRYSLDMSIDKEPDQNLECASRAAEWICAGFSGEGMVHAWKCGIALATMLMQSDGVTDTDLTWFPEQMTITQCRISNSILPREILQKAEKHQPPELDKLTTPNFTVKNLPASL